MDWYSICKFLHIVAAIVWLGGALIMVILGMAADRARDDKDIVAIVLKVAWAAERVYVPASMATLVFGIVATTINGLWSALWVNLGFVGIVVTICLGVFVLTPRAKRAKAAYEAGGATPEVIAISRDILTIARFDMAVLFTVVADMVLKPGPGDWGMLAVFAAVILVAALLFLPPAFRRAAAA